MPVNPYMPEKSGLPSTRGIGLEPAAFAAVGATGAVPATVTVTARVTAPIVRVYVVVALGVTLIVPRCATSPIPLSMDGVPDSVAQDKTNDSPGFIEAGLA